MAMALGLGLSGASAQTASNALPTGGNVAAGTASISQSGANMVIDQSTQRAVINWQSFNVGKDAHVQFNNGSGATLNRVNGPEASTILGRISATGQVTISNGNGVFFGRGSRVDVGSLVATTHSISNDAFMAGGPLRFERNGSTARVVNEGELSASLQGYVALLAPEVRNSGVIVASKGTVALAAGEAITLQLSAQDQLQGVVVEAGDWQALVDNRHVVEAEGGLVILSARALQSVQGGVVRHSGSISASSLTEVGGRILLTGDDITLASGSSLEATGATGGGAVLVGGDWQGGQNAERRVFEDPNALYQATTVTMEQGATIDASATDNGKGGTVVLWSDVHNANSVTHAAGSIFGKGAGSGGGGQVETSGHRLETPESVRIDTTDAQGRAGVWLLDPYNYTIAASGGQLTGAQLTTMLNSSNIEISTADSSSAGGAGVLSDPWGRIYVDDSFTVPIGKTLTLKAHEFTSTISTSAVDGGIAINNQGTLIFDQFTGLHATKQFWVPLNNTGNITFIGNRSSSVQADFSMDMNRYLSPSNGSITVTRGRLTIGSDLVLNGKLTLGGAVNGVTVDTFKVSGALTANGGVDLVDFAAIEVEDDSSLGGLIENSLNKTFSLQLKAPNKFIELDASYSNPIQFISKPNTTVKFLGNNPLGTLTAEDNGILFIDIPGASRTLSNVFRSAGFSPANASLQFTSGKTLILTNTANIFTGTAVVPDNSTLQVGAGSTGVYTGKVNLVGANSIYSVNSSSSFTTSTITGLGQVIQSGPGTLTLNGSNTYSGATTINSGGIVAAHANALGNNSTGTTVLRGFLGLSGNITLAEPIVFDANDTYLSGMSGTNIFSGSLLVNGSNLNLQSIIGILQVNSAISGNFGIVKISGGTVVLNGNNDFTGSVTINGGVLVAAHNNALGSAANGTSVTSGATLALQGDISIAEPLVLNGTGVVESTVAKGALRNLSGNNTVTGAITLNSDSRINSDSGTLTIDVSTGNAITGANKNIAFGGAGNITVVDALSLGSGTQSIDSTGTVTLPAATLTPTQIGLLTTADVAALSPQQIAAFDNDQMAAFTATQITGLTTIEQAAFLANLNASQLAGMNNTALAAIDPVKLASLGTGMLGSLSPTKMGQLTAAQLTALSASSLWNELSTGQVAGLTAAQLTSLSSAQVAGFTADQLGGLTAAQLSALSAAQQTTLLSGLTAAKLAGLSNAALAAIEPSTLAGFASGQLSSLSAAQIGQFSSAQFIQLSASGLWTELTTGQMAGLTAAQLTGLSSAQLAGFTAAQLAGLSSAQVAVLTAAQLVGLTAAQRSALSGTQNNQSNPPQVPVPAEQVQPEPVTNSAVQNNQGNPKQGRLQAERAAEAANQARESSVRASTSFGMASVAVNPSARVSSSDVKVELVRSPELQTAGIVTVSMPSDMAASSAGFAFALPNELFGAISNAVNVDATLVGGQPLPSWLQFDSINGQFLIGNVANVSFPLELSVQLGTQVFMVVISVRSI
jgi:filamentous hemagglutinin family protein